MNSRRLRASKASYCEGLIGISYGVGCVSACLESICVFIVLLGMVYGFVCTGEKHLGRWDQIEIMTFIRVNKRSWSCVSLI
jgi:hypothetical protein